MKKENILPLVAVLAVVAIITTLFIFIAWSLKPEPEFYIGETGYYTREVCVESHSVSKYGYHYGFNPLNGKIEYHYGYYTERICDEYRTDILEIK